MKRTLLFLFILLSLSEVKASDTLTVRQVFNFNVGDTFDYAYTINHNNGSFSQTYSRFVIIAKTTSVSNDTITYIREQIYPATAFDTLIYTHLDSSVFEIFDTVGISQYLSFDTAYLSDGRLTNSLTENVPLGYGSNTGKYGEGLGVMYSYSFITDGSTYTIDWDTTLVYYSKASDTFGIPYYAELGPNYAHYTPIPEECAFWGYCGYASAYQNLYQIRTGNKINFNGHTYVELILRSFVNDTLSADATIGFFRNDTLGQKVYFTLQPGDSESVLYDFTYINTKVMAWNYINASYCDTVVSAINTGGMQRALWSFNTLCTCAPSPQTGYSQTLEGVGALVGFFNTPGSCTSEDGVLYSICPPELQVFCVCGQSIYHSNNPYYNLDTIAGQCALLTGISTINLNNSIHFYPNPTTDQIHLSISDMTGPNYQLILTDILGQQVYSSPVTQSESMHDISKLSSGIYTWRVIGNNSIIKTGKVVKE